MPRTARAIEARLIYHVLNRGNGRMRLFHKAEDYQAFERVLAEGLDRYPLELLTYCIMPNHWHLVVRPDELKRTQTFIGQRVCVPPFITPAGKGSPFARPTVREAAYFS